MKISLTLSLLNDKMEYELLVLFVTLKRQSTCDDIFLLKRSRNGIKTLLLIWIVALINLLYCSMCAVEAPNYQ